MMETTMIKIDWENMKTTDSVFPINRERILVRIMDNLVRSGILLPGETSIYRDHFYRYDWDELLQILNESNKQKAECISVVA